MNIRQNLAIITAAICANLTGSAIDAGAVGARKAMKVTSVIFDTMSGKLGGAVAAKARGGIQYLRKRVIPSNPQTANQSFIRAAMTGIAAAWRSTLTSVQRAGWTELAHADESGIDVYTASNVQVVRAGLARVDAPPTTRSAAFANTPAIVGNLYDQDTDAANITITNGARAVTTGGKLNVYASSGNQSPSRLAQQHPYTYVTTIPQTGSTTSPVINLDDFLAAPWSEGTVDGDKIGYVRVVGVETDGRVTSDIAFRLPNHIA